ncbi:MAG: hypothetical protein WAL87_10665 [Chthoniobacterales bacterium]
MADQPLKEFPTRIANEGIFATCKSIRLNPKIALEGGDKEFYQEIRKTGMEGNWQAGRD